MLKNLFFDTENFQGVMGKRREQARLLLGCPLGCIRRFQLRARLGSSINRSPVPLINPYVPYSGIRASVSPSTQFILSEAEGLRTGSAEARTRLFQRPARGILSAS